jgi:hypothetical protein
MYRWEGTLPLPIAEAQGFLFLGADSGLNGCDHQANTLGENCPAQERALNNLHDLPYGKGTFIPSNARPKPISTGGRV